MIDRRAILSQFKSKERVLLWLLVIYSGYSLLSLALNTDKYLWDFRTYYFAAKAHSLGFNPYDLEEVNRVSEELIELPYVYPPATLYFFKPFLALDYDLAAKVYWFVKLLLMLYLVGLWLKMFCFDMNWLFAVFLVFGFNAAMYQDFRTGNITVIVQAILWTGFYLFYLKRYKWFAVAIVIASLFKLLPIYFLGLLVFSDSKRKYAYIAASFAAITAYLAGNYLLAPEMLSDFVANSQKMFRDSGIANPNLYWFVSDFYKKVFIERLAVDVPALAAVGTYLAVGIFLLIATVLSLVRIRSSVAVGERTRALLMISLMCLLYSFLSPRFKDYDYVMLLAPSFLAIIGYIRVPLSVVLVIVFGLTAMNQFLPYSLVFFNLLWSYFPMILALVAWWGLHRNWQNGNRMGLEAKS